MDKQCDKSIAKVSSTGKVTGVKKGTVTITASFKYKGKTYKKACRVTVKIFKYGTVESCITWKYDQFVGTRGDDGATVVLIPKNTGTKSYDHELAAMLAAGNYESGIWVVKCDGYDNYSFGNRVPTGNYMYLIVSNNTTMGYRFNDEERWEQSINNMFGSYFSKSDLKTLKLLIGYNSYSYGFIEAEKDSICRLSKDFGYTYI